jgi:hypothetical protein
MVADKLVNSMGEMKRRQLEFTDFSQVLADIRHLESAGYIRVGKWSLGQMCDHLTKSFDATIVGFQYSGPWYFRVLARRMLPGILKKKRVPAGAKIPKRFEPPAEISDEIGVWKFTEAVERFEKFTGQMAVHPYFGVMTNAQWRALQLIHCSHHLSFLVPK